MREVVVFRDEIPGKKVWIVKLLLVSGLVESKREARQLLSRGKVMVNGQKVADSKEEFENINGLVLKNEISTEVVRILVQE